MLAALVVLTRTLALICSGHREVPLENVALRQQLAMFRRTVARPHIRPSDRLFWILADGPDGREAGHRRQMASAMAPTSMETPLCADTPRPPQHECGHSDARQPDGRGQSLVGACACCKVRSCWDS